jgi:hypothetical protein
MKKLQLKDTDHFFEYSDDVERIIRIFADRGYEISYMDAAHAWELYSDSMAAGWMSLEDAMDSGEYVFQNAFYYFKEVTHD